MRSFLIGIFLGTAIGALIATNALDRFKQNSVKQLSKDSRTLIKLDLASSFNKATLSSSSLDLTLIEQLNKESNSSILIKFHRPETTIPIDNLFDAVSSGAVDTALSSSHLWSKKSPAFELFSSVPFGPDIISYLTWFRKHGGQVLYENLYSKHNIYSMICGIVGANGAGWFKYEINSLADFKKHKIAASGLVALVYSKLGATTINISPSNILSSLEQGKVNAVASANPTTNQFSKLSKHITYYYFPGWFQQLKIIDLMINLKKWNSLNKSQKEIIETACLANITHSITASEASQFETLKKIVTKGVDVRRLPDHIIVAIENAWLTVANSQSKSNEDFRNVLDSLGKFRKNYSIWQELGKI